MNFKKIFKPLDAAVIAAVLAASLAGLLITGHLSSSGKAMVYVELENTREYLELDRNAEVHLESSGIELTVSVINGECSITDSSCPDKLCVKTGKISKVGENIVCLPAKAVVGIESIGGGNVEADAVAG